MFTKTIFKAARKGDLDLLRGFIGRGTAVDGKDSDGRTPLMHALQGGHMDAAEFLIGCGASTNERDNDGKTPLFFLKYPGLEGALLLLNRNANVNVVDSTRSTPLISAICKKDFPVADLFIAQGAEVNLHEGCLGFTPLMLAIEARLTSTVIMLLGYKADPNAQINAGHTPLMQAACSGDDFLVLLLLAFGADPNVETKNNVSPLLLAEIKKQYDTARLIRWAMGVEDKRYIFEKLTEYARHAPDLLDLTKKFLGI